MTRFAPHRPFWEPLVRGADVVHRQWGWLLGFGLLTLLLGTFAIIYTGIATLTTVLFVGWLTLFGGLTQTFASFYARHWHGFLLHLCGGIFGIIVGTILVRNPGLGALTITLLMATYFCVSGALRTVAALALRFEHWGWSLLNGLITVFLGVLIWSDWQRSAFWVIGFFVGIDLILAGWTLVSLAMVAREFPGDRRSPATPAV